MAFKDQVTSVVHEILSDPLNLPAPFLDYIPQFVAQNPVPLGAARAPMLIPTGTTGATAASRLVGATTSGAPTSGTFRVGDVVFDQAAGIWVCITAGSPGSWRRSGDPLDIKTNTNSVSTAGTTFAAGADLLASALSFTADGTSSYLFAVAAPSWTVTAGPATITLRLNLDSAADGIFAQHTIDTGGHLVSLNARTVITPSAGAHTLNARLTTQSSTATVNAGAGGSGVNTPIFASISTV